MLFNITGAFQPSDLIRQQTGACRRPRAPGETGEKIRPAVIINDEHLISGGQPAEVFEQALRRIAAAG